MTVGAIDLRGLVLKSGSHLTTSPDVCVMECVAILACAVKAPEPVPTWEAALAQFADCKTDRPPDACRVLTRFMTRLNDGVDDDERQRLVPYALTLIGTRASWDVEMRRAYVFADAAVRIFAPLALEARGLTAHAATLRAAAPIVNKKTAAAGSKKARAAAAAYAADAAAYAATATNCSSSTAAYAALTAAAAATDATDAAARERLVHEALAAVDRAVAITADEVRA